MTKTICSIYDCKAEFWSSPMMFQSRASAVRSFTDVVNDSSSDFFKHPEDYTLFAVGTFDEASGEIIPEVAPVSLAVGINVKEIEE